MRRYALAVVVLTVLAVAGVVVAGGEPADALKGRKVTCIGFDAGTIDDTMHVYVFNPGAKPVAFTVKTFRADGSQEADDPETLSPGLVYKFNNGVSSGSALDRAEVTVTSPKGSVQVDAEVSRSPLTSSAVERTVACDHG
jgi:hypothetical protein